MSVVKYCPKCSGRPYTKDHTQTNCPYCSAKLETEMVPDALLANRQVLPSGSTRSGGAPVFGGAPSGGSSAFGGASSGGSSAFSGASSGKNPAFGGAPSGGSSAFGGAPSGGSSAFGGAPSGKNPAFGGAPSGGSSAFGGTPSGSAAKPTWGSRNTGGSVWPAPVQPPLTPTGKDDKGQLTPSGSQHTGLADQANSNGEKPLPFSMGKSKLPPTEIKGKVSQYSNSDIEGGRYRRLFAQKLFDAMLYGQRTEDLLHRFKVRVSEGVDTFGNEKYTDVEVNVHGTISGGSLIADNSEVEVSGKYKNGVLMARRINVVNNGYRSPVNFQRSVGGTMYAVLAVAVLAFIIILTAGAGGNFFDKLGKLLTTWLITAAVLTVLYFLFSFSKIGMLSRMSSGKRRSFPLVGILLVSLVIAMLIVYGFGANAGSLLSGVLSKVISAIVTIVVIFVILKLILGLF
ncbi:MAG: hypothetical protein IKO51_10435 [Clostridia bacterium]|nr:hypothetical protein [Clostridia bacterium]